jgi:hypothetical protein
MPILSLNGESELLLAAKVMFCRLDRNVAEQELNLAGFNHFSFTAHGVESQAGV